jgi:FkbM family methyltransferase
MLFPTSDTYSEVTMRPFPVELVERRRKYLVFKNDCGVSDAARMGLAYEDHIHQFIKKHLDVRGTTIIDIGANFGFHTIEFAEHVGESGKVYAFEPQLEIYWQLCANMLLNGCTNVHPERVALGDKIAPVQIEKQDLYSERTINIGDNHCGLAINPSLVGMWTLDDYNLKKVSVIKMDVQGFEPYVLDGAKNTFAINRPTLFIEIEPGQLELYGMKDADVFRRLGAMGYDVKHVHNFDWMAFPRERKGVHLG